MVETNESTNVETNTEDTTKNEFTAEFEKTDSGAADFVPMNVHDLRKGGLICMGPENRPCKITDISTSKTGKHGHAKANITAVDIFNGKKYNDVCPASHNKDVPNIKRTEYSIMGVDDEGYVSLVDKNGNMRQDLKLPNDIDSDEVICKKIKEGLDAGKSMLCTVLYAMKVEKIEDAKEANE